MCGWPKADHSEAAQAAGPRAGVRNSVAPVAAAAAQQYAGCDNYRVDMTAARFGDCVCGQPKAAHSAEATSKGAPAVGLSTYDKPTDLRHPKASGGRAARLAAQRARINEKMGVRALAPRTMRGGRCVAAPAGVCHSRRRRHQTV